MSRYQIHPYRTIALITDSDWRLEIRVCSDERGQRLALIRNGEVIHAAAGWDNERKLDVLTRNAYRIISSRFARLCQDRVCALRADATQTAAQRSEAWNCDDWQLFEAYRVAALSMSHTADRIERKVRDLTY